MSALLTAAIVFLAKNWISERIKGAIKNEYDLQLESHKSKLKSESDTQIEQFKAQLHIAAAERSIRLTRVFEKTVETVAGTYERLLWFHDAVAEYTSIVEFESTPPKEERRKILAEKYQDFLLFYRPRRPFLPKRTVSSIDDFRAKLHKTSLDFMWKVEKRELRATQGKDHVDTWFEAHQFMTEKVPPILSLLEDDLRKILGTHDEEPNQMPGNGSS